MPNSDVFRTNFESSWPEHIPMDLHLRLLDVLSYRTTGPKDIWDELREWLTDHDVQTNREISELPTEVDKRKVGSTKYSL